MALIEGRSLAERISKRPLPFQQSARIVAELAEALAHAHGLGIIHRDVKPANIRLDNHDAVYLMDFGIAYLPDSGEIPTPPGTILGTPAYLAPELAQGGQMEVLPASDQYSLGAVLYETLCGQPPFFGPSSHVLFHAIHHDPPSPRTIDSRIPKSLAAICQKAMAKQPDRRYSSCQELADDLRPLALRRNTPGSPPRLGSLDSLNLLPPTSTAWGQFFTRPCVVSRRSSAPRPMSSSMRSITTPLPSGQSIPEFPNPWLLFARRPWPSSLTGVIPRARSWPTTSPLALRRNTPGSPPRLGSLDSLNLLPQPGLTRIPDRPGSRTRNLQYMSLPRPRARTGRR